MVKNDEYMITSLDLLIELIDELSENEINIIISIFNPVIYDNLKRIYKDNQLETDLIYKIPIFDKKFIKILKKNLKNSF